MIVIECESLRLASNWCLMILTSPYSSPDRLADSYSQPSRGTNDQDSQYDLQYQPLFFCQSPVRRTCSATPYSTRNVGLLELVAFARPHGTMIFDFCCCRCCGFIKVAMGSDAGASLEVVLADFDVHLRFAF